MKIAVASDLHLEFGDLDIENTDGADVLLLSGDICVAADLDMRDRRQTQMGFARWRSEMFHGFFERCAANFPHVIYVTRPLSLGLLVAAALLVVIVALPAIKKSRQEVFSEEL